MLAMCLATSIRMKLAAAFVPCDLRIEDQSARHSGHAGARPEGESHFHVRIVSPAFAGLSRIERQRRVHAVLADELRAQVHALSIAALTPEEAQEI